jgi:hypothetical protein
MPVKRKVVGTGLTKFGVESVFGRIGKKEKAAIDRIVARHNRTRGSFDAMVAPIERTAKAILKKAGGKAGEIQSQPWYAQEILWRIGAARNHIKKGESELAAMRAFEIGQFHYEAFFKDIWECHTESALRSADGRKRGLETQHWDIDLRRERRRASFNKYRAQGLSVGQAKEKAAAECKCHPRSINRALGKK